MRARQPASNLIDTAKGFLAWWLISRSPDRDTAFRESFLRSAVVTITALGLLSFGASIWVFQDEWRLLSFPTLHIYALATCFAAGYAVTHGRAILASWLLVLLVLLGAGGVMLLSRQNGSVAGVLLAVPIFCMVPIMTAMVLPLHLIIPISLVSTIGYAIAHFMIPAGDFRIEGLRIDHTIVPVTMLLLFEGILLRQLRLEFDARLTEMRKSVVEIER
ncbi:MAG: hypothetical protein GX601_14785, partial [Anaerolineales bacterium]|nr:hypothetical protein [Anaerolineales bacterium]